MIALLYRSRHTLGPYPLPPEWLAEQEQLYWIQRELNHRGSAAFVKRAMHSPRKISRARARVAEQQASETPRSTPIDPMVGETAIISTIRFREEVAELPPLACYEAEIEQVLARELAG